MAIKRYKARRKPAARRVYKQKRYKSHIVRGVPSGMPNVRIANLRYSDTQTLTSSGSTLVGSIWRANSIHDPQQAIGGHRPMGTVTWAGLYNHYVVLGSKITCNFVSATSTGVAPGTAGIYLNAIDSFPYTTAGAFIEAKRGSHKQMPVSTTRQISLRNTFSTKKFFNVKDVKDNLNRLGAATNANPVEEAYYLIWFVTQTGTTTWYFTVTIDYCVLFSEPKSLQPSP